MGHTDILYGDPPVGGSYRHIVWIPVCWWVIQTYCMVTSMLVGHTDILYGDLPACWWVIQTYCMVTRLLLGHTDILYGDPSVGGSYRHIVW